MCMSEWERERNVLLLLLSLLAPTLSLEIKYSKVEINFPKKKKEEVLMKDLKKGKRLNK